MPPNLHVYIYPQNAGNAVSETQISRNFRGACTRTPLELCRHYGPPLTKILATLLNIVAKFMNHSYLTAFQNLLDLLDRRKNVIDKD